MATIRKRGDLQWEARIRRRGYPVQCKTFETKTRAETWVRQVEGAMDQGLFVSVGEAEHTTLAEVMDRYDREVVPRMKAPRQIRSCARLLKHSLGHYTLAALSAQVLAGYRDRRLATVGRQTVRHDLSLISRILNTAMKDWGIYLPHGNPVARMRVPAMPPARARRLVGDEEFRLRAAAARYGGEIGPILCFAIETAMRRGEIAAMQWAHLDRRARVLRIPDTKTGEPRRVPLSSAALAVLDELPRRMDGRVWTLRPDSISQAFERVRKAAGIDGLTFHDLRHEATSRLFEKGLNPMEVAAITGHKTLQMLKRYTHLRAEDLVGRLG